MTMYVVKVLKNGQVQYAAGNSILDEKPLVDEINNARAFEHNDQGLEEIKYFLDGYYTKEAHLRPRSGICVDEEPKIIVVRPSYEVLEENFWYDKIK